MNNTTSKTRKLLDTTKILLKEWTNENIQGTETSQAAVDTYVNGNVSDFKKYLNDCSKQDICDVIEILRGQYGYKIHDIIRILRQLLPAQ